MLGQAAASRRVVDLLNHLPTGVIERVRAPSLNAELIGRTVIVDLTPIDMRQPRSGRGPTRIFAADADGNTIALVFFNNPGWAKKQLPLGELRTVTGKLETYGDEWQIIHPEVAEPGKGAAPALREPVYPLTEGITNRRMGELAAHGAGARARAARMDRAEPCRARGLARVARSRSPRRIATPAMSEARQRLAYDEIFANQLALLLLRQSARRKTTVPLPGDGRLSDALRLPYALTIAQQRVIEEIRGDMAQARPMLRLLQGDVGSGKTLVAMLAMLAAIESGAQAAFLVPTEILARQHYRDAARSSSTAIGVRVAILTGREKGKAREAC